MSIEIVPTGAALGGEVRGTHVAGPSDDAAWGALPGRVRRHLGGRRAVFDFTGRKRAFPPTQAEIDRYPPVTHPIVRTHPDTGRKCLYVMRDDCTGIEEIGGQEAEALIAALADHIVKPAFIYRHQWRAGDLLSRQSRNQTG